MFYGCLYPTHQSELESVVALTAAVIALLAALWNVVTSRPKLLIENRDLHRKDEDGDGTKFQLRLQAAGSGAGTSTLHSTLHATSAAAR